METVASLPPVRLIGFVAPPRLLAPEAVARVLGEKLRTLAGDGSIRLLARASLGSPADMLFAREVGRQKIPLSLLQPLEAHRFRETLPEPLRQEAEEIVARAAQVEIVPEMAWPDDALPLGVRLVDEADHLIIVTQKQAVVAPDTIAEILAYASTRGRPLIVIEEDGAGGAAERPVDAGEEEDDALAEEKHLARIFGEDPSPTPAPAELVRYFEACDAQAARQAPEVRSYLLNIVIANATAAMAGSISSSFPQTHLSSSILTVIKFTCILTGLIIFAVLTYRRSQNRWLEVRLKAEVCRSALATWCFPRPIGFGTAENLAELHELIQSIRYYRAVEPAPASTLEAFKAGYGRRRLADQYRYFRKHANHASRVSARFGPAYWVLAGLSLFTSFGAVIYQSVLGLPLRPGTWVNFYFQFIPAIGPALASWVLAFQAIQSVGRRRVRYREMERWMRHALLDLARCTSWETAFPVVERAEKLLLNEVAEWYLVSKYGK